MSKATNRFAPELCKLAVRLALDDAGQHESCWSAIPSMFLEDWLCR